MMSLRATFTGLLALVLVACASSTPEPKPTPRPSPTRDFPTTPEVHDNVYQAVDRTSPPPAGYGLYTVLLTRTADRKTVRVLSELFTTTGSAGEAVIARENLNLITIPVKSATDAAQVLNSARNEPDAAATELMQRLYDFNQAAMLMASVCRPGRGASVTTVCGSAPDGPLLVTTQRPLDGNTVPDQRLLIVNLSSTPPEAIGEVLAAYRRQISRDDFTDRRELDGWRLRVLNHVLDAAQLLPGLSKAYAGS